MSDKGKPTRRFLGVSIALTLVALFAAACGGSNDTAGTTTAATDSQVVAECQKTLDTAKQPLQFTPPGPAIDASKLKGKKVTFVSLAQAVPTIADAATKTVEAGKAAGIDVSVYDGKGDVSRFQQGISGAVAQKQDAIILLGIPTDVTQGALQKASDAGIPVVSELNNEPDAGAPGQGAGANIFATTAPSYVEVGGWLACQAIVATNGKANVVIFGSKELKPSAKEVEGIRAQLAKCTGCTVSENSTPVAKWQTDLAGLAQSEVRKNPDANYLLPLYDGMGIFVTAGVQQSGSGDKVKVASFNATPAALDLVKNGSIFTADPGQPPGWLAWGGLDQAMRGMLKVEPGDPKIPMRFFDKANLQGVDTSDQDALFGSDYKDGFLKLWGLQ